MAEMKVLRFVLTMVAFAMGLFAVYTIGLAAVGLFSMGNQSLHAWRILTTDSAGISYLVHLLISPMPIGATFTCLLLPLLGYLWFNRLRVVVIGGLVLLVSVFQIPAAIWVEAGRYGGINFEGVLPPMIAAVTLAVLSAVNFAICLLIHALRWRIRAGR